MPDIPSSNGTEPWPNDLPATFEVRSLDVAMQVPADATSVPLGTNAGAIVFTLSGAGGEVVVPATPAGAISQ